jgi:hypothetical protein
VTTFVPLSHRLPIGSSAVSRPGTSARLATAEHRPRDPVRSATRRQPRAVLIPRPRYQPLSCRHGSRCTTLVTGLAIRRDQVGRARGMAYRFLSSASSGRAAFLMRTSAPWTERLDPAEKPFLDAVAQALLACSDIRRPSGRSGGGAWALTCSLAQIDQATIPLPVAGHCLCRARDWSSARGETDH